MKSTTNSEKVINNTNAHYLNQHVHFVGIGGAGMSGIAKVLVQQGCSVSGSDLNENQITVNLRKLGAHIFHGHSPDNINGADILVISTAISDNNPEITAARNANIPIIRRAEMLDQLMNRQIGIAVTGTHGKTTTAAMIANVLIAGGVDPTFVIGSQLNNTKSNARLGSSQYVVAEADESDASFLYLHPKIAVITNIDIDHLWAYKSNFEHLCEAFIEFLHHLPENGLAILCIDDPVIRKILHKINCPILTYGFSEDADIRAVDFQQQGLKSKFTVNSSSLVSKKLPKQKNELHVTLQAPGKHNVLNALAAIAIGLHAGLSTRAICSGLGDFQGTERRFQIRGHYNFGKGKALLIDDYGHHPQEIAVTIAAVRAAWPNHRHVLAFQPHRYSRTDSLFAELVEVLATIDHLILLDTYPAGEQPIVGATGSDLCHAIAKRANTTPIFIERNESLANRLPEVLQDNDILLMQGAGDIGTMAANLSLEKNMD